MDKPAVLLLLLLVAAIVLLPPVGALLAARLPREPDCTQGKVSKRFTDLELRLLAASNAIHQ